jgi:DNA-binding CsgD family transcriptional regulator
MTETLTRRQGDVLRCMSKGQSNKQIARELNIALGSVKVHASALFSKLGIRNRTQAAMRYAQSIPYQRGGLGQATSPDRDLGLPVERRRPRLPVERMERMGVFRELRPLIQRQSASLHEPGSKSGRW